MRTKETGYRALVYILGLLVLAMGLTLNTRQDLVYRRSFPYRMLYQRFRGTISETQRWRYMHTVLTEMILHTIHIKRQKKHSNEILTCGKNRCKTDFLMDLQIPLSIVFTRFLNLFSSYGSRHSRQREKNAAVLF